MLEHAHDKKDKYTRGKSCWIPVIQVTQPDGHMVIICYVSDGGLSPLL